MKEFAYYSLIDDQIYTYRNPSLILILDNVLCWTYRDYGDFYGDAKVITKNLKYLILLGEV